jgi:hypothetical protein
MSLHLRYRRRPKCGGRAPEVLAGHDGAPPSTLRRWIHPMAETELRFGLLVRDYIKSMLVKTESTNRCAILR